MSAEAVAAQTADRAPIDLIDGAFVLVAGFPEGRLTQSMVVAAAATDRPPPRVEHKDTLEEAEAFLLETPVAVLVLGPDIEPERAIERLEELSRTHSYIEPVTILIGPYDFGALQPLVQGDRLFFFSREELGEEDMAKLVSTAVAHYRDHLVLSLAILGRSQDPRVVNDRRLLTAVESLHHISDLDALEDPLLEALDELIGIDDGRLWIYDSVHHLLSSPSVAGLEVSATAGITSFVARTGVVVRSDLAVHDARFDPEADDGAEARLLVVPILDFEQNVLATVALRRPISETPFSTRDQHLTWRLAQHLAPIIIRKTSRPYATRQRQLSQQTAGPDIFRPEAIQANEQDFTDTGRVLHNEPGWTRWTWGILLTGFIAALIFGFVGSMHEYANGPAVVRVGQRIDVPAHVAASVIAVEVAPGARVETGQPLVRLYGAPEISEIANLEDEFEQLLRRRLARPGDAAVEASLINARTNLERARARLAERIVRAPSDGIVGDVRIRPGQHLEAGEFLLSVISDREIRSVVGLVPGHFGPQITPGQRLRLTLNGYPDLSLALKVASVGEEVIGQQEARQSLGASIADSVIFDGSVVLVEGHLPEALLDDGRRKLTFRDGMQGVMEIRVRTRPILFHLVPGLDRIFRRSGE